MEIHTKSSPIPSMFFQPIDECGAVEVFNYTSTHHLSPHTQIINKHANVYLPYGYDRRQQYNVIYLLHGWTGNAEDFVSLDPSKFRNLLDNLIFYKKCSPFILVSPTWDCDNQEKDWDESCEEIASFWKEYLLDLIPAVESRYTTFANNVDYTGLKESRNHRLVGGFSLGGIATWYIFQKIPSIQNFYISMSGECWDENFNADANMVSNKMTSLISLMDDNNYLFYQCVGTKDSRYKKVNDFMSSFLTKIPDTEKRKFRYMIKENGFHSYKSAWEFLYNIIPAIFPYDF